MSDQRHIVNELSLELRLPGIAAAHEIQTTINNIVKDQVTSMINKLCNELVDPDIICRLDTIEIDLGVLNINSLEEEFIQKIKLKLVEALTKSVRSSQEEHSGKPDNKAGSGTFSRLELLNHFLKTGNLTWWADSKDPQVLERNLAAFVNEASENQVTEWVQKIRRSPATIERLIRNFSDESLFLLVQKLSGKQSHDLLEHLFDFVRKNLSGLASLKGKVGAPAANRVVSWQFVFFEFDKNKDAFKSDELGVHFFFHLASAFNASSKKVFKDLAQLRKSGQLPEQIFPEKLAKKLERIPETRQDGKDPVKAIQDNNALSFRSVFANLLNQISTSLISINKLRTGLFSLDVPDSENRKIVANLLSRINLLQQMLDNNRNLAAELSKSGISEPEKLDHLTSLLKLAPDLKALTDWVFEPPSQFRITDSSEDIRQWADQIHTTVSSIYDQLSEPSESKQKKKDQVRKQQEMATGEEIYVNNAGLVLLAPFYKLFFQHLELVKDGEFVSEAARFKAIHLLHFLSYGEENTLEFLLPLNKIICGWHAYDPVELDTVLSVREKEECSNLIMAAVGHVPVFKNISVDGFRGSYILRNGIVSVRDRNWLLQVEKQSYDILLEKVPWKYNIVKLPWMDKLIYVEWQTI